MRYQDIASGIRLPVYVEEEELMRQAERDPLPKNQLDERDQEVARLLVSRGLLRQYQEDGQVYYRAISVDDIWRDRDG